MSGTVCNRGCFPFRETARGEPPGSQTSLPLKGNQLVKMIRHLVVLAGALLALLPAAQADLRHRYPFNDPSVSTNVRDAVGTANGFLVGSAAFTGDGRLVLDGNPGYVQLPGHLVDGYAALTIEAWVSFGQNGNWVRLFDLGDTDAAGLGQNYIFFTPHSGLGDIRLAISDTDPGFNNEQIAAMPGNLDNLGLLHIAAVLDPSNGFAGVYTNGVLAASNTNLTISLSGVSNVISYIGKSLYAADAYLTGTLQEFRIYDQALTASEIASNAAAGPPTVDLGPVQSVHLQVETPMFLGAIQQTKVLGNFANATNVNLTGATNLTFRSSKPLIVSVNSSGTLQALGLGTATITAIYQSLQATQTVAVILSPPVLKHRYSFSDAPGSTNIVDSVGSSNGVLFGGATLTGTGSLNLDGVDGYAQLPTGIISSMTNATFEAWVTWNDTLTATWERIFDFGSNTGGAGGQGTGQTYLYLSPRGGSRVVRFAATLSSGGGENPVLNGSDQLPVGHEVCVTVVYNVSGRSARLFVNGQLVASGQAVAALKNIKDINNWLGRSQYRDPNFNGQYDEFRIYEGALSDTQIAIDAAAGPDTMITNTGPLQSLSLASNPTNLLFGGFPVALNVAATFQNVSNVNVASFPELQLASSDTNVIRVSTNGLVEPVGLGSANLTASYLGQQAALTVAVTLPPGVSPPTLIHRYGFNDPTNSTTIKDSAGTADGTLHGAGTVTGNGQLTLPGTTGYVELPGGIISSLTNVTFEAWVTWRGTRTWERIFDFGSNTGGAGGQGTGETYLFLTPLGGSGVVRFAATANSNGNETPVLNGSASLAYNKPTHLAVTYNFSAGAARLYLNGQRIATGTATIPLSSINDVNVWLGRSQWPDPNFTGLFNEFRIYDGALSDGQIAADFNAGPDFLPSDLAARTLTVSLSSTNVIVSWPTNATSFVLESNISLGAPTNWTTVGAAPTVQNGQNQLVIPVNGQATFYRLRK